MASDFENIRAGLKEPQEDPSSGQGLFIFLLIAVLAIGGVVGYLVLPRSGGTSMVTVAAANDAEPVTKTSKLSKSDLKKLRRAEMRKFRETQAELRNCSNGKPHKNVLLQTYTNRNQAKYNAWTTLSYNGQSISKPGAGKNGLESTAYVLTGGMQNDVRDIFADVEMELNSNARKVDPIKCGQLNSEVQRRKRDLETPPNA